ncbi:MAG: HlyD family efflux transporter periplasmic adaptor subunit [Paracoccaceae bacterium]
MTQSDRPPPAPRGAATPAVPPPRAGVGAMEGVTAVLRLPPGWDDPDAPGAPRVLFGDRPEGATDDLLRALAGARPQMRRLGEALLISLPRAGTGDWLVWALDHVPPVTALSGIVTALTAASAGFRAPRAGGAGVVPAPPRPDAASIAMRRLSGAGRLRPRALRAVVLEAATDAGIGERVVTAWMRPWHRGRTDRGRRVRHLQPSDQLLLPYVDEMRQLMARRQGEARAAERVQADELGEDGLDAALLADMGRARELLIDLPPLGEGGLAVLAFAPASDAEGQIEGLRDMAGALGPRRRTNAGLIRVARNLALAAAAAALVAWLTLPAPLRLTAPATSEAAMAVALPLPLPAYVDRIEVAVGDRIDEGDVVATFRSLELEDEIGDVRLQVAVAELEMQTALAQNDRGAYALAEQRRDTQRRRQAQLERRLDQLVLRADASGTVIQALPRNLAGTFVQTGETVATVQPVAQFDLHLLIARIDAPRLAVGQPGEVFFRGLADETYPIVVTQPTQVEIDPATGAQTLSARARVTAPGTELIPGLSGFARITADEAPRIVAWTRYAREYLRERAWIYLDWRF